jgi:transposase
MVAQKHTTAERIQALALIEEGVPVDRVTTVSGMSKASIYRLQKTARARGYDPAVSRRLKDEYVQDAPRSGRPKKLSPEQEQELLQVLQKNRNGHEKTMQQLASEAGISSVSVYRIMRKHGLQKAKPEGGVKGETGAAAAAAAAAAAGAQAAGALNSSTSQNLGHQPPVPDEGTSTLSQDLAEVSQAMPQSMPQSIPQANMHQGIPQSIPGSLPQGMPQSMPQSMPTNIGQSIPGSLPQLQQGLTHNLPQVLQPGLQQAMPQSIPQSIPQSMPQSIPQSMPQSIPDSIPNSIPQSIPQSMTDTLPDAMTDTLSDAGTPTS